jgi:hypothetical protein
MVTIREALLSDVGEDATSIQPIIGALSELGFNVDDQAGRAFSLLQADQAAGLNVRQRLALKAAIRGAQYACACLRRSRLEIRGWGRGCSPPAVSSIHAPDRVAFEAALDLIARTQSRTNPDARRAAVADGLGVGIAAGAGEFSG